MRKLCSCLAARLRELASMAAAHKPIALHETRCGSGLGGACARLLQAGCRRSAKTTSEGSAPKAASGYGTKMALPEASACRIATSSASTPSASVARPGTALSSSSERTGAARQMSIKYLAGSGLPVPTKDPSHFDSANRLVQPLVLDARVRFLTARTVSLLLVRSRSCWVGN